MASGDRSGKVKLLNEDVLHARKLYQSGYHYINIAEMYGVHKDTMRRIVHNKTRRSVNV